MPALNDLLVPFGAAFESGALESDVSIPGLPEQGAFHMASGVPIKALPAGAWLHRTPAQTKEGAFQLGGFTQAAHYTWRGVHNH